MQPTVIGAVVAVIALILMFRRSATAMLAVVMVCSLFGGASGVDLPALGGSSVPPADFALLFLAVYLVLSSAWNMTNIVIAVRQNAFLVVFCLYGAVSAYLLPRIFAGAVSVVPMHIGPISLATIYDVEPLGPSAQNITTAVYLLGTLFAALATALVVRIERSEQTMVRVIAAMTWAHVFFGLLNLALYTIGHSDWLSILRNGNYAQLDQNLAGFQRISGIFPEPSAYAGYGFGLLVADVELWLRNVRSRWTGPAALAMLIMLMLTTSSTAYVACAGYALLLAIRFGLTPAKVPASKLFVLGALFVVVLTSALVMAVFVPDLGQKLVHIVQDMTVGKATTLSGRQRLFWAQQGIYAFEHTFGLGVGVGSFRSSSLLTAIAGSMGVIGLAAFLGQNIGLLQPFDRRSHDLLRRDDGRINAAAGWAAVIGLIPAVISAPGPDPAVLFGILSGLAVARRLPVVRAANVPRLSVSTRRGVTHISGS